MTRYKGNDNEILALDAFIGLMRAADRVSATVHRDLSSVKLSISQFGVLEAVYHRGPMHQKEIAKRILKSTGNITMVIDNLEKRGLVLRERNPADRRFFTIRLTPEGEKIIGGYFPGHVKMITRTMGSLNNEELKLLKTVCRKLVASI